MTFQACRVRLARNLGSLLLCALLVLSLGCGASAANRSWREIKSGHLHVIGTTSDEELIRFVRNLRSFRALVEQISGTTLPEPLLVTKIYVLDGEASLADIRKHGGNVSGQFMHGYRSHFSWIDATNDFSQHTAYHEYVHVLQQRTGARYPFWYAEGLAEFLSTAVFSKDNVVLGRLPARYGLVKLKALAFGRDLGPATGSHITSESRGQERDLLYARVWAMVSFALLGHLAGNKDLRPSLTQFLGAFAAGRPEAEAFMGAFGMSFEDFVKTKLYPYVRRDRFPVIKVRREIEADFALPKPRTLSRVERLCELGDLYRRFRRHRAAAEHFRRALAESPDHARAMVGVAVTLSNRGDSKGAFALFSRALRVAPDVAAFHVDFGDHLARRRGTNANRNYSRMERARAHYRRALEIAPQHPEAYIQLGASYAATASTDVAAGIAALKQADELIPHMAPVYFYLGALYARIGRSDVAREYLQTLLTLRKNRAYVARANKLLADLAQ